jgi:hypothetical protein
MSVRSRAVAGPIWDAPSNGSRHATADVSSAKADRLCSGSACPSPAAAASRADVAGGRILSS